MRHQPEELEKLRPAVRAVLANSSEVRFAFLHGSAQQGLPFRDLDIAVLFRDGWDFRTTAKLAQELEEVTGCDCDVHPLNEAPNLFAYQASQGELLGCADDEELAGWKETIWSEYFRYQPHRERLIEDWLSPAK